MKHLKKYYLYESSGGLNADQEIFLNRFVSGPSWVYEKETGLVHLQGTFRGNERGLKDFKGIKFGIAYSNFQIASNELTSLKGCPSEVHGHFDCNSNILKSLEGSPKIVKGYFDCSDNQLSTLKGGPEFVGHNYFCGDNPLISLEGLGISFDESIELTYHFENNGINTLILSKIAQKMNNNRYSYSMALKELEPHLKYSDDWKKLDKSGLGKISDNSLTGHRLLRKFE